MITNELIERINYLARKQRTEGLTDEEKAEQQRVRRIYIDAIKEQVRNSLDTIKFADKEPAHGNGCSCGHCHGHQDHKN